MWNPFRKKEPKVEKPPEKVLTPRQRVMQSQQETHAEYFARRKEVRQITRGYRRP